MQISIKINGMDRQLKRLDPENAQKISTAGLKILVESVENRVGIEANQTVYSYIPITDDYIRTGRLLGGRGNALGGGKPNSQKINESSYKIQANPKLKGASLDYAPFVNFGSGFMTARPFFTNSYIWGRSKGVQIAQREMTKMIKEL